MTSALARKYAMQVATYTSGTAITAVSGWTQFKGLTDFNDAVKATIQSVADFDNNGYDSSEKTLQTWSLTAKARRPFNGGVYDPGQEIVRAARLGFGDQARVFVRFYDTNGGTDAWGGVAIPDWTQSKTATADVEEIQVVLNGDGTLTQITNPYQTALAPAIQAVTPSGAGTGQSVVITGANFTGTVVSTGVKFGGTAATSFTVINDQLITAVLPTGSAGSTTVQVTNGVGAGNSFTYTRAA